MPAENIGPSAAAAAPKALKPRARCACVRVCPAVQRRRATAARPPSRLATAGAARRRLLVKLGSFAARAVCYLNCPRHTPGVTPRHTLLERIGHSGECTGAHGAATGAHGAQRGGNRCALLKRRDDERDHQGARRLPIVAMGRAGAHVLQPHGRGVRCGQPPYGRRRAARGHHHPHRPRQRDHGGAPIIASISRCIHAPPTA